MKLSNSSLVKYLECPRSYKYQYKMKLYSKYKSSALYFGGAFDLALNELMTTKDLKTAQDIFLSSWRNPQEGKTDKTVYLPTYQYIQYYNSDFDSDLLFNSDYKELYNYCESNDFKMPPSIYDFIKQQQELKRQDKFKSQSDVKNIEFYNLINWLVLANKGNAMLIAYRDQLLPKFKNIVQVQIPIKLESQGCSGDTVEGVVDFVAELDDGTFAVMDNKTSSVEYTQESVRTSQQLTLYTIILNQLHAESKFPVEVTRAGYAVIRKKPIKTNNRVCTKCGFKSDGKHKKCNNVLEDKSRCNGDWNGKLDISFETQFFVDQISTVQQDMVLETVNEVNKAITHEIFTPNLQSCIGTYGKCVYYDLCHNSKMDDFYISETENNKTGENNGDKKREGV